MYKHVDALVATALSQSRLSGLSEMLKSIAETMDAYGSILWQVAPDSQPETGRGNLQVLAEWFPEGQISALYSLPIESSVSGYAVVMKQAQSEDVESPRAYKDPFFAETGIRTFCCLPLCFADGSEGCLNLYRNVPERFSSEDLQLGARLTALVPKLYQTIRDRVSFNLIHEVHEALHEAEIIASDHPLAIEEMKRVIQRICDKVGDSFQCIETSIFLEDRLKAPDVYELAATIWPYPVSKRTYCRDSNEGLTGWVLEHAKPVNLPNLSRFEQDYSAIQAKYPGLIWRDSLELEQSVRRLSPDSARDWLPLSFLAVPIVRGDRVYGVIRCSVAGRCPYSFASHEEDLLALVAAQIGRSWSSWLNRREVEEENRTWKNLVESLRELNKFALAELSSAEPKEGRIFRESLRVTSSLIAGAEIMDIRLLNDAKQEGRDREERDHAADSTRWLYFAETAGDAWHDGEPEALQKLRNRRFPVGDPTRPSAGAHVVETGDVYAIPDVSKDPYYWEAFPKTKRMILAPMLSVADGQTRRTLGVLDIRGTDLRDFPRHAEDIAGLLGSQLGLYHGLVTTINRLQRLRKEQIQTFQDLRHQFKTPIIQAHRRTGLLLKSASLEDVKVREDLLKIRGLVAKAMRVSLNTGLFANLAQGKPLIPRSSPLKPDELIKLLIEAGSDNQLMINPSRRIEFKVERAGLERLEELEADKDLLEQAVYDLLDNAFKYSFNNTVIRIFGGVTGSGRFHITVLNKGIPIYAYDVPKCSQREWQSEEAQALSGGGTGIGLWIVDHIMKAHGGELLIMPTRANHETEIKLIFPKGSFK